MLVLTGLMLGIVLLVMVGEQAQEMQLANWIPTSPLKRLSNVLPAWIGLWFSRHDAGGETLNSESREYFSPATGLEG